MKTLRTNGATNRLFVAGVALAMLASVSVAQAEDRGERWEFTLGTVYQLGADLDFEGGSTIETDDDLGFLTTVGYNINDRLEATFGFKWASIGYDSTVIQDDGGIVGISGDFDNWSTSANLIYNFMDGNITPYAGAGIGWSWIDTNVPNGLPSTGCYWDPWWGYICYTSYPTKSTDALAYQATLGLRWDFNYNTFVRMGYVSQWLDLDNASGTPRFDGVNLEIGWMF